MITIELDANIPNPRPGVTRDGTDRAACTSNGRRFTATSRTGSIHKLCRMLRDAGVPDQPWQVPGRISGGSIFWMADRSAVDTDTGIRTQRFNPIDFKTSGGQKGGADPEGVG